jgi:SAM-dependent methyltransferase
MTTIPNRLEAPPLATLELGRCLACEAAMEGSESCPCCGTTFPVESGILEAIGPLSGTNRIAAQFYDGPLWSRFRFWEQVFLWFQGVGVRRGRWKVLRHLPLEAAGPLRVLEVGIGDGENLALLPGSWEVFGVDIARGRLSACLARHPSMWGRLAWAEGERLPFLDGAFDVVFTVGGLNYFRDPAAVLSEMRRVVRPGGRLVAADEIHDLHRFAPGHALGLEGIDRLGLRLMGLDSDFIGMVLSLPDRITPSARAVWPRHRRLPIWNRLGYCLVDVREG